jgi:hypothetical protein
MIRGVKKISSSRFSLSSVSFLNSHFNSGTRLRPGVRFVVVASLLE